MLISWSVAQCLQFFFEPDVSVVGVAEVMRSAALRATSTMKSWISWRLRSAIAIEVLVSVGRGRIKSK